MRRLLALLVVVAALASGCSQASGGTAVAARETGAMPDDFTATIVYRNGSVPPPYHFEWRLRVDGGGGELSWRPGYDEDVPAWVEAVAVSAEQRAELYAALRAAGAFDKAPAPDENLAGGSTGSVELTAAGRTHSPGELGLSEDSQDILEAVHTAAEDVVPAAVWSRMSDRQQTWGEQNAN